MGLHWLAWAPWHAILAVRGIFRTHASHNGRRTRRMHMCGLCARAHVYVWLHLMHCAQQRTGRSCGLPYARSQHPRHPFYAATQLARSVVSAAWQMHGVARRHCKISDASCRGLQRQSCHAVTGCSSKAAGACSGKRVELGVFVPRSHRLQFQSQYLC